MTDPVFHEMFVLYPAWSVLVGEVTCKHPAEADPQSVYGSLMAMEHGRLAALLYGNGHGESLEDATNLLDDLLLMAQIGVRPKFGLELGLGPEAFGGSRS